MAAFKPGSISSSSNVTPTSGFTLIEALTKLSGGKVVESPSIPELTPLVEPANQALESTLFVKPELPSELKTALEAGKKVLSITGFLYQKAGGAGKVTIQLKRGATNVGTLISVPGSAASWMETPGEKLKVEEINSVAKWEELTLNITLVAGTTKKLYEVYYAVTFEGFEKSEPITISIVQPLTIQVAKGIKPPTKVLTQAQSVVFSKAPSFLKKITQAQISLPTPETITETIILNPSSNGVSASWTTLGAQAAWKEIAQGVQEPTIPSLTQGIHTSTNGAVSSFVFQAEVEAKLPVGCTIKKIVWHYYAKPSSPAFFAELQDSGLSGWTDPTTAGGTAAEWRKHEVSAANAEKTTRDDIISNNVTFAVRNEKVTESILNAMYMEVEISRQRASPIKSINAIKTIAQGQIVKSQRSVGRIVVVAQEQMASLLKVPGRIFKATQSQVVSLVKSAGETFHIAITTITQNQTVALMKGFPRNLTVTQGQVVNTIKSVKLKALKPFQEQIVSLSRGKQFLREFFVAQEQSVSFASSKAFVRIFAISQPTSLTLVKKLSQKVVLLQEQGVGILKGLPKTLQVTQEQDTSLIAGRAIMRLLTIAQETSTKLSKSAERRVLTTQAQNTLFSKVLLKIVRVEQEQITIRSLKLSTMMHVFQEQTSLVFKSFPRQFLTTQFQSVSLKTSGTFTRIFAIAQAQQIVFRKKISKTFTLVQGFSIRVTAVKLRIALPAMGRLVWNSNREGFADMKQFVGTVVKGGPDTFIFRLKRPFGPGSNIKGGTTKDPEWQ